MSLRSSILSLVASAAFVVVPGDVRADHYSGANITYECLGANFFRVTLDLYLDCSGTALTPQTLTFANDCGVNFTQANVPVTLTEEVSQLCPSSVVNSTCSGGPLQGIRHFQLQTTVFLSPCNDWTISWSICCRNNTGNLLATPGMYVEATVNNAGGLCDNSPVIANNTIPFVCQNDPILFNPGMTDPDGNTLSFQMVSAQFSAPAPTNVTYDPGFNAMQPIPGITLDPATGQLAFTPTVTGNYVVVVEATSYDVNGVTIGTVMRDFMFVVMNCMGAPPVTTGLTNSTSGFIVNSGGIEVCQGVPFCVDIPFTDEDPVGSIALTSNAAALLPGATFVVTGTNPAVGRLCWTPDPAFSPANVLVTATDNACPIPNEASASILITVVPPPAIPPDAGTDGNASSCTGGPAIALFPLLGGTPDAGGVWTDPNGVVHNGAFTPPNDPFGIYTYTTGNGCQTDDAIVTVAANGGADPGTDGTLDICTTAPPVTLISGLGGSPQAGGAWSGPSAVVAGNYDPATMAPGVYTYTVPGVAPCPAASASVTVTENPGPSAGTNGTLAICSNGAAVSLITRLGGTPQAGGAWSGPSAVPGGNYDPATMIPGVYTYTVTAVAPCADATATVTVTENTIPNAGTNGTLTVCSNGAAVSLSTGLGGAPQAGGVWSGPSAVVGGNYDPVTMTAGVYTYTVTGVAPCVNSAATVTVTENAAPNAGTNGTLTLCANGAAVALSTGLGGAPQAGGVWSGPSVVVGGTYDPVTMTAGVYTYTVTGVAPCANSTATVTITENAAPNAGVNGTMTVCGDGAAVGLSTGLGGAPQAGGTWSGPSAVVLGNYDPATMTAGVYTYTVTGVAPCVNSTATVTVTENAAPNAGADGTLMVCGDGAVVALSTGLGGAPQAGGIWSGPSAVVLGNYDPATMTAGVYTYTVTGVAPCVNSTATVTVTENAAPNAGTNGTLTVCSDGAAVALSTGLGGAPQAGGVWSGPSAVVGGNYDPATMTAGVYTYAVTGVAPCVNSTATVTVTENAAANAGTDGALTVCSDGASVVLTTGLGGAPQAGGTWSGPSAVIGGNYDPATMTAGIYTYLVTGAAPCPNSTAMVTVMENTAPDAGTDGVLTVCSDGATVTLASGLGGAPQAGGAWSGPSVVVGGNYDPVAMTAGAYTYTVAGQAPCANVVATVTVTENVAPNAGTDGTLTVCGNGVSVALSTGLSGSPQAGGAWNGPSAVLGGNYDPATMNAGAYTYVVAGIAPCANSTATVTVTENASPNAGTDAALTVCSSSAAFDLFTLLGAGADAGGNWSGPSVVAGNGYDPATMDPGVYVYTITAVAPCMNDEATVTVNEIAAANAGVNGALAVCASGGLVPLSNGLGGSPQTGGSWSGPSAVGGGNYNPATMAPGVYTYTVLGSAPCANASATVTVSETATPNAGSVGNVAVCSNSAAVDLFALLGPGADGGGNWSGPSVVVGNSYDPATMNPGFYTYTIAAVAPCLGDAATVTVTENALPNAGTDGALTICDVGSAVLLLNSLGGSPQAGGTWSGPSAVVGGSFDPATMASGAYTYTVTGVAPCTNATATVTVNETGTPNAGVDGALTTCGDGTVTDLFALLGADADGGGSWSGPSPVTGNNYDPTAMVPGIYTYSIAAVAPCAGDAATITVTENAAPNAGSDGALTICDVASAAPLSSSLGGTPQAGGTWSGPSAVIGGNYDPATMTGGVYTYTVVGVAPCSNATATVTVNETSTPDAGVDGILTVCGNGPANDLFALLGPSADGGGTWSGPSAVIGNSYDPTTMVPGIYTYNITAIAPCPGDAASITITENAVADAGTDGSLTVCDAGGAVTLLNSLGGTPQAGGTWSGPSVVAGGSYDPATMTGGVYSYTVIGVAPCGNATATVTVNETGTPDAGVDGTLTVCGNGPANDLFALLGPSADVGGTWSGPSAVIGNSYDPIAMAPGVYTYNISAVAPCSGDAASITVTENAAADAGTDDVLTICDAGSAVLLLNSLGGTPQSGGTWSGPSVVAGGSYDPATMTAGVYTYTVAGVAPCTNAIATVTVNETGTPNAGVDGALNICDSDDVADLFALLGAGADPGGTWTGPVPVVSGQFDPSSMTGGTYTYTVAAAPPCNSASASVVVTLEAVGNAGADADLTVCAGALPVDLFTLLGASTQPGGTWAGPDGSSDGTFDPGSNSIGDYIYTIVGTVCPSVSATITTAVVAGPDAGSDGDIALCSTSAVVDLFDLLGGTPDGGGTWTDADGQPIGTTFDPALHDGGVFTYSVAGNANCPQDQALVGIVVSTQPIAGTNGVLAACANSPTLSLFDGLGGTLDAGGSWTAPDGTPHGTVLDPATDPSGVYTYTVTATAPCVNASAMVTVNIATVPDAGENSAAQFCSDQPEVALLGLLGGTPQPNGAWTGPGGTAVPSTLVPASCEEGTYTYTVTGAAPCGTDVSTLNILVGTAADAGTNGSLTLCANNDTTALLIDALSGSPATSGSWTSPDGDAFAGSFTTGQHAPGIYTYTVVAETPCLAATAEVLVDVIPATEAQVEVLGNMACAPAEVTISNTVASGGNCTWLLWNGEVVEECGPIVRTLDDPGFYPASLVIDAGNGCGADTLDAVTTITVFAEPEAAFYSLPEAINTLDPVVQFNNASSGATLFLWDIAGLASSEEMNPSYRFPLELGAEYTVCLIASASANCRDSVCETIVIEDGLAVYVPNTFTPDGSGFNDGFKPVLVGADPRYYRFDIFDRWGQALYGTDDPNAEWDGRFADGTEVPIGVYVWKLRAKDPYSGARIERLGHVTLLR